MANDSNRSDDDRFVDERLKALDGNEPLRIDETRARARLQGRLDARTRWRRPIWIGAALVAAMMVLLALPWPRAAAQQLWERLTLGRIEIIQITGNNVPDDIAEVFMFVERGPLNDQPVKDLAEAARIAGFQPSLPAPGVLAGVPNFAVVRSMTSTTRPMRVKDVERALAAAGITDVVVPPAWDGVTLTFEGGPVVLAQYPEAQAEIMQLRPVRMTSPSSVRFDEFMEVGFRLFGRNARDAHILAKEMLANPALLMHFPRHSQFHDVRLRSGRGIIVGGCLFFNTEDRLYLVSAQNLSDSLAIKVADSIQ
jgi:hypothetical protein